MLNPGPVTVTLLSQAIILGRFQPLVMNSGVYPIDQVENKKLFAKKNALKAQVSIMQINPLVGRSIDE